MLNHYAHRSMPIVSNPCAPYGAQGLDSFVLIWRHRERYPAERFRNAFHTPISLVDWSHDGQVLLAGSMTGEVLAWQFPTGQLLLANRLAHSYAPIQGISCSPGGAYVVALTLEWSLQVWRIATRECLALLPGHRCTTIIWSLDGDSFRTDDGLFWVEPEGGLV